VTGALQSRARVTARGIQITLGLLWLLDGLLQFQSFMYTHALITQVFDPAQAGQGAIVAKPMQIFDNFYGRDLTLWNTLSGEIQCAIGLGLILSKKTVRPALIVSFVWALSVWWFGEGFGGLTSNTLPSALMGAPGAVFIYGLIGLLVYPTAKEEGDSAADLGPLGDRGAEVVWSGLWLMSAVLWVVNDNRTKSATHDMIVGMASSSPQWLATLQNSVAADTQGHGVTIAIVLAILSLALAAGVWSRARRPALAVGVVISLAYWVVGQSMGGPFWAGQATDVNSGPLFVLLAFTLMPFAQGAQSGKPVGVEANARRQARPVAA
jgi:hypothetical protein